MLLRWALIVIIDVILILLIIVGGILNSRSWYMVLFLLFLVLELSDETISNLWWGSSLVYILISDFSVDDWHISQGSNIVILHYKNSATDFDDIIDFQRV